MKYVAPAISIALLTALPAAASTPTIAQLVENPSAYQGRHVQVKGTVEHVEHKISHEGNPYLTFSLCSSQCIPVFAFGNPKTSDGDIVTVRGTYQPVNHLNGYTLRNGIVADGGSGDTETPCS